MITNENYVNLAEKVIQTLKDKKDDKGRSIKILTTSKIRNLLAMTADIYNDVVNTADDKLNESICSRIEYLRVRFIYEAGREPSVKNFVDESKILDVLSSIKGSKKQYILFNRYMEALVAYRKFLGGKDE